ncbi:oxidoreductase (plasmid) [Mycolicibacterium arabiense]|uniref:Oxidoreductase n=1 Tax=Mycolicibacterium arabiense TaxID=1286181 RepID=A0A7I7RPV8_9MYCO|nr:molybdopterin cofactor-binding domain-containing protein [Mycolicibacterium arabiense]MCV7372042.1 xanthine dehydrogenase family protein molybdopterin-binding subunit [Mycolicibacterium arabiense]BBY46628.1 oxidoreductase [Mycolicibacterium arabiense]
MAPDVAGVGGSAAERRLRIITGQKTYASDYRPKDLGWPEHCAHALLLRASVAGRAYTGIDLGRIRPDLRPDLVITATDLRPPFQNFISTMPIELFVTPGQPIDYVGQPIALLLYDDFMCFRRAAQEIREDAGPIVYAPPPAEPVTVTTIEEELTQWRNLRCDNGPNETHYLLDVDRDYSQWTRGQLTLANGKFQRGQRPDPDADRMFQEMSADGDGRAVQTTTYTQTIDPAFLEPEAGLGWLDPATATLNLVLGTQSPYSDVTEVRAVLGASNPRIRDIRITAKDMGGGFGGRDKSPFTLYLAVAAAFAGSPVRLAFDRREQFQGGLKRHASAVHSHIRAAADGTLDSIRTFTVLRGGPETNLNGAVLSLAALHATGPYRVRRAGSHAVVVQRPIPTVGSMRGFGIPQVAFNVETAIDRLAVLELGEDPIAFRSRNVLRSGTDRDLAGTPLRFHLPTAEICDAAHAHELWQGRHDLRCGEGVYRGVGFACCMEAYGTSSDSVYCAVRVTADGGIEVWSQTLDMGQGARQSLELVATEELGRPARADLGITGWFEKFAGHLATHHAHDPTFKNWSLVHGASSASKTAFFHVHALREACRALLRLRLLPAARVILGEPDLADEELLSYWRNGEVQLPGRPSVPLADLAAHVHQSNAEPGVMVHGYFNNGWSSARFTVDGHTLDLWVDGLAFIREPGDDMTILAPQGDIRMPPLAPGGSKIPRSVYASGAHLIGVTVDTRRGAITVTDAVTFLDAGDVIARPVVDGQVEGGLAMGIAHTLFEELPPETGAGPFANFDRYRLPRWNDLRAITRQTVPVELGPDGILGPDQPNVRHKGIGEVTMTTVAPAIANAVAHALGHVDARCWPTRTPIRVADLSLP